MCIRDRLNYVSAEPEFSLYDLKQFDVVFYSGGKKIVYSGCEWKEISNDGEKMIIIAAKRQEDVYKRQKQGSIRICQCCTDAVREFGLYRWNDDVSRDIPIKENDHAMDDIRYFVTTLLREDDTFFAIAAPRGEGEQ